MLSLHDALPIPERTSRPCSRLCRTRVDLPDPLAPSRRMPRPPRPTQAACIGTRRWHRRSEEHTSELQSLMRCSYAVFCLKKKIYNLPLTTHISSVYHFIHYNRKHLSLPR